MAPPDPFSIGAGAVDPGVLSDEVTSILSELGQPEQVQFQTIPSYTDAVDSIVDEQPDKQSGLFKAGLSYGGNSALASTLDFVSLATGNPESKNAITQLRDIFEGRAKKELGNNSVRQAFSVPFSKNIAGQTAFNVASALPLFGTALATTFATSGLGAPASLAAITGASTFYPSSYTNFFREAMANGMDEQSASNFATIAGLGEVGLETFAFGGFLKGGSALRQILRGVVREGVIEEGSQQLLSNSLKIIGFKGTDNLAQDLTEGLASSIVAGSVLGAGGGAVSSVLIPTSQEDLTADLEAAKKSVSAKIRREAFKQGLTEEQVKAAEERVFANIPNLIPKFSRQAFKDSLHTKLNEDIAKRTGLVEVSARGQTFDRINLINEFDEDTRVIGRDIMLTLIKDREAQLEARGVDKNKIPKTLRDLLQVSIMEDISEGFIGEELEVQNASYLDELLGEDHFYVIGTGKENVDPGKDLVGFSPEYGEISLDNFANNIKNVEKSGIRQFSLLPKEIVVLASIATRPDFEKLGATGLTGAVAKVIEERFNKSKKIQVRDTSVTKETATKLQKVADRFNITDKMTETEIQAQLLDFFDSGVVDLGIIREKKPSKLEKAVKEVIEKLPTPALTPKRKTQKIINEKFNPKVVLTRGEYKEQLRVLSAFLQANPDRIDVSEKMLKVSDQYDIDYPPTPNDAMQSEVYEREERYDTNKLASSFSQDEQDIEELFSDNQSTQIERDGNPALLSYTYTDENKQIVNDYRSLLSDFDGLMKALIPIAQFGEDQPVKNVISMERFFKMVDQGLVSQEIITGVIKQGQALQTRQFDVEGSNEVFEDVKGRIIQQSRDDIKNVVADTILQINQIKQSVIDKPATSALNRAIQRLRVADRISSRDILKGLSTRLRIVGVLSDVKTLIDNAQKRTEFIGREITFDEIMTEYHKQFDQLLAQLPKILRDQIKSMSREDISDWLANEEILSDKKELQELNDEVAAGGRPVTLIFNHPVRVIDIDGKAKTLKGKYKIIGDPVKGTALFKDGVSVTLTKEEIARMKVQGIMESLAGVTSTIDAVYHANRCGSPCAGGPGEPRSSFNGNVGEQSDAQQWNYQQNKIKEGTFVDHEVDPENPRSFSINSFLSMTGITRNISILKENLRKNLFPDEKPEKKQYLVDDQIVTYLYGDKRFQRYAQEIATVNIRPTFELVFGIAEEMSKELNQGKVDKGQSQKIWKAISKIMFFAGTEIYSREGNPSGYSLTEIGNGGIHEDSVNPNKPAQEAEAYVEQMILAHKSFSIPFQESDVQRWKATRDRLSFFNMLSKIHRGSEIQAALVYNKAQLETPLLERSLDAGLFKGADMWKNIDRGFQHRVFDKRGAQKEESYGRSFGVLDSADVLAAKYRTNEEFVKATDSKDLEPVDNYFSSMIEYLSDYETMIAQQDSIQAMKGLLSNNQAVLEGFENNGKVNDLIKATKMVEYKDSDVIKALAKETGWDPDKVLSKLDFVNDPTAPGFAEWTQGSFQKPFLFAPFKQAKDQVFRKATSDDALSKVNQVLTFFKRFVTVNPFDASALFMTPVFLNYNFRELLGLPVDFFKSTAQTPEIARQLLRGEQLPSLEEDIATYENYDLFIKHGWTAYNYQSSMESLWDKAHTSDFRELQTHGDNIKEYVSSVGGLNTAIFQNFIGHNLYNITDKIYQRFLNQGLESDRAARLAVKFTNDTSFMLNPDIFGAEGKILVTTLFTRNLTIGFLRLIAGASFPFLPKKWFQMRTGGFGALSNSITHGDTSMEDMSFLARYYQIHVLKALAAGMLFNGVAQFAMSFIDDDERDEHGQIANGDFKAKKRFTFANERNKRSMIRTPFTDIRGGRVYWSPQLFREAQHIQQILGDWGSQSPPENFAKWFTNRLSLATIPIFLLFNRDYFGNEIRDTDLDIGLQTKQVKDFLVEQGTPLGFRQEERKTTGKPVVDVPLLVAELFGLNKRTGVPTDPFTTVEQINKLRDSAAVTEFLRSPDLSELDRETLLKLRMEFPRLFNSKVRSAIRRQRRPGASIARKLRRSSRLGETFQGRELEVSREIDRIIKGKK